MAGRSVSQKTKRKQHRGEGHGKDYKPEIRVNEVKGHLGTHVLLRDYKHGRAMHFLSQGEASLYYLLRFQDNVADIREQFPLPIESTKVIAESIGKRHPMVKGELIPYTIDLMVTYTDGHLEAYSVKYSKEDFYAHENQVANVYIMKLYSDSMGIPFHQVYTDEMNTAYADNIARFVYYWDPGTVRDKFSLFMYLVAHKYIQIDLKSDVIDLLQFHELSEIAIPDDQYLLLMAKVKTGTLALPST